MEMTLPLRHISFVADGVGTLAVDAGRATSAAFAIAREAALAAYAAHPALTTVSFFSPEIRDWLLDPGRRTPAATACAQGLRSLADAAREADAAFRLLGRLDRLPPGLDPGAELPGESRRTVAWFLDYGGREEIARAAERFRRERPGEVITEEELPAWLDTAGLPDPDLILYAGGVLEPKDFLLWQGSYAELWHTPLPWHRFSTKHLEEAVQDYRSRHRRFGR